MFYLTYYLLLVKLLKYKNGSGTRYVLFLYNDPYHLIIPSQIMFAKFSYARSLACRCQRDWTGCPLCLSSFSSVAISSTLVLAMFTNFLQNVEKSDARPYSQIPGPPSYPLIGNVLGYKSPESGRKT